MTCTELLSYDSAKGLQCSVQIYNVIVSQKLSKFISPLSNTEKNRHFEVFEVSQLSNGKHVLLCTNMSGKSIAEYCKILIKSIA